MAKGKTQTKKKEVEPLPPKAWYSDAWTDIPPERLDRMKKVAEMWNRDGLSCRATAQILGVSAPTVHRDRKLLVELWRQTVMGDVSEIVGREVAKLDAQEAELWAAWERSKADIEHETTTEKEEAAGIVLWEEGEPEPEPGLVVTERNTSRGRRGRIPDAHYQNLLLGIAERRARLLGLDKSVSLEDVTFNLQSMIKAAAAKETELAKKIGEARRADGRDD